MPDAGERTVPLDADDAERLAWSAMLSGRTNLFSTPSSGLMKSGSRRVRDCGRRGRRSGSACERCHWARRRGAEAGWRVLSTGWEPHRVECGYMRLPLAFVSLAGDHGAAGAAAAEAIEIADRHHDRDSVPSVAPTRAAH